MIADFFAAYPHLQGTLPAQPPLAVLGPGSPREDVRPALAQLTDATLFDGQRVRNESLARCCHSGLWLAYDFLDESHRISQEIDTVEGSYWHGIMHRREPDYSNAKYWFRRVPRHPVFELLRDEAVAIAARQQLTDPHGRFLLHQHTWNPAAFVDLCAAIANGDATCEQPAREVALAEWRLLFDSCYAGAVA